MTTAVARSLRLLKVAAASNSRKPAPRCGRHATLVTGRVHVGRDHRDVGHGTLPPLRERSGFECDEADDLKFSTPKALLLRETLRFNPSVIKMLEEMMAK